MSVNNHETVNKKRWSNRQGVSLRIAEYAVCRSNPTNKNTILFGIYFADRNLTGKTSWNIPRFDSQAWDHRALPGGSTASRAPSTGCRSSSASLGGSWQWRCRRCRVEWQVYERRPHAECRTCCGRSQSTMVQTWDDSRNLLPSHLPTVIIFLPVSKHMI